MFARVGAHQSPQAQPAESAAPQSAFTLTVETVDPPRMDLKPYLSAVSAVLRHTWPAKIRANLIVPGDKGIVFVRVVILRSGSMLPGSATLEIPSAMGKLNDASLDTVLASSPFDQLPESLKSDNMDLRLVFRYGYLPDAPFKDLYESADRAARNQNYIGAVELLETLLSKDPDYTNGWNYLGWLYNRIGKYDKAVTALRKAIEINPRDLSAYNNLGQAYSNQKKYEEAVPQYLKQIEVNKNDRYANANLGRVYLALDQYDKAITALELAAKVSPKEPSIYYNLGRAYGKANQPEKAEEAFQKSVELEPVPMRYNDVAYQMAVLNLDLPTAQRYAQTGIGGLTAKMRETSLDQVGAEDTRMAAWLGMLWDTMGWVLFQEGKMDQAKKYIKSAWFLHANGEVGYHLGRVYEAQGNKEDAIRLYLLSLGAARPNPEAREHVSKLLGTDVPIDEQVEKQRPQLTDMRTVSIPNSRDVDGVAEFWILLAPGPKTLGAKFITGDDAMRSFEKDLQAADYPDSFAEATDIRLLRRGRLACVRSAGMCRLLLASAETVRNDN